MIRLAGFSFQQTSKSVFVLRGNRMHLCIINDSERQTKTACLTWTRKLFMRLYTGNPTRRKSAPRFFLPCRVNLLKIFYLCASSLIQGFLEAWYLLIRRRN